MKRLTRTLAGLALALALPASATTVLVTSIAPGRVDLIVNGTAIRSLRAGEVSPEGVRAIEIGRDAVLLEVDGKRWSMRLGSSTASSVVLQADARGHFIVTAYINGRPARALVDTGATSVAMGRSEAARLGVNLSGARPVVTRTAGGERKAWLTRVASVQIGEIALADVEVAVGETDELTITLLGMSFLNRVEMQRSGSTLILTRRH